jgi:putative DNA primase/helicase
MRVQARHEGPEIPVYLRVAGNIARPLALQIEAQRDGSIELERSVVYVDLGDRDWRIVKITAEGWEIITEPEVRFTRPPGMRALAEPERGGSIDLLRALLNVEEHEFPLLCGWLVNALHPSGPYAVLGVHGAAGSAKSTLCEAIVRLTDPQDVLLAAPPRMHEVSREVIVAGASGWVVAYDNISTINANFSDALCRLTTGVGSKERRYFTNFELASLKAKRPVVLNGITEVADRGDLLDRLIVLWLQMIPASERMTEEEFEQAFAPIQGKVQGALFDAVAGAMRTLETISYIHLPRLADFATWAMAAEESFGFEAGTFARAYAENRERNRDIVIDDDPLARHLIAFARLQGEEGWVGSASEFLAEVSLMETDEAKKKPSAGWPKSPEAFAKRLQRLGPDLRAKGADIRRGARRASGSQWLVCWSGEPARPTQPAFSAELSDSCDAGNGVGDVAPTPDVDHGGAAAELDGAGSVGRAGSAAVFLRKDGMR